MTLEKLLSDAPKAAPQNLGCWGILLTLLSLFALSGTALGQQQPSPFFADNFTNDSSLNTQLWTDSSSFLTALADGFSSSFVTPQLAFSSLSGMQMSGPTQDSETTGVQSLATFTAPFTVVTYVTPVQGTANPLVIFLASADLTQYLTASVNFSQTYDGMWVDATNLGVLTQLGEQFSPPIVPAFNTLYQFIVTVDGSGNATVTVKAQGTVLGILSGLTPGTGPFYLVLGQRIGNAPPGPQVADWSSVTVTSPAQFVPITPCRLVDTRQTHDPIQGGTSQSYILSQLGGCGIPTSAAAYSLNVTVVPITTLGYLTIWPTDEAQPIVSTMNSPDGRIKANAAIVPAGTSDAVSVYATDTTNIILDIDGYFAPPASGTYQFYPLTPCRIVDTRNGDGGMLQAGVERDYTIAGNCDVPSSATAYSFNVTVLPSAGGLDYLTVWPQGESQPVVSTLNDNTGTVVANAAIVPAGSNSTTAFYAHSNATNLLVDVDGYFAAPGTGGLSLYPVAPCRVLDTRQSGGSFVGEKTVNVVGSACAPPSNAAAYVFNATVVPPGPMLYLSLWPDGEQQPTVSTLNAEDGFITSNMAIVPTNNGSIDAFAAALTQLILDISGYFAP